MTTCKVCAGKGKIVKCLRPMTIVPCKRCGKTGEIVPLKDKFNQGD